jgi:sulfate/thiosulfate transport system substrate-binding protein
MKRLPLLDIAAVAAVVVAIALIGVKNVQGDTTHEILNVSYDPTRELYRNLNAQFIAKYQRETGIRLQVKQSHGGSSRQARSVVAGEQLADVVTLGLYSDVDALRKQGLIEDGWADRLPHHSQPYYSTIVFVVRKGNPKAIKDWDDLVRSGVKVVTPNPKTSGGARWNYLAAWGYAQKKFGSEAKAKDFVKALYANVPVLDTGARGSTVSFATRGVGDVLIAWENEAFLSLKEFGEDKFEIVVPSLSILAEPPVAVVDKVVDRKGTRAAAEAYLKFLYSRQGQEIAARQFYRPSDPEVAKNFAGSFPDLQLITVDDVFGGWRNAQKTHFADKGVFDEIYGQ